VVFPQAAAVDTAVPDLPPREEAPLVEDKAGNGSRLVLLLVARALLPQEPCLETADRDDWAVLFLRVSTRRPLPAPALLDTPGKVPLGPGRLG